MKNLFEMSGASKVRETGPNEITYRVYDDGLSKHLFLTFGNEIMKKADLKPGDRIAIGFDDATNTLVITKQVSGFKIGRRSKASSTIGFAFKAEMGLPEKKMIFADPLVTGDKTIILKIY